jgi:hypothetical protein
MINALRNAGGSPRYTEYPGVAHESWLNAEQESQLIPWVFAQSKPVAIAARRKQKGVAPELLAGLLVNGRRIRISGTVPENPYAVKIRKTPEP